MRLLKLCHLFFSLLVFNFLPAQNYQAIHGSVYAGSLGVANNPASIVHVPFAWDVTPFSVQAKQSTNAYTIKKYSLLSSPNNITLDPVNGTKKRFVFANQDIHLLNTRIRLNARSAIAFGANIRSYMYASTSKNNYQDTAYSLADFFSVNLDNQPLSGDGAGSAWAEGYISYGRTIIDDGYRILNAGMSIKLNRSIAGGYINATGINYISTVASSGKIGYQLTEGRLQYGYSSNFDLIDSNRSSATNTKSFLKQTYTGVSADIGIEYIFMDSEDEEADDYAYKTKIGISLLDIGGNKYKHSSRSRFASAVKTGINDTLLENKFNDVRNIDDFNDSLATVANVVSGINGDFVVYKPTRLVINADYHVRDKFFVNAELTVPVISLAKNSIYIKDMNLLAITPRWETKRFGAYLPVLVNMRNQVWMGGALRAGPLLLGTHNLSNIFSKNKMQNGGFYLTLTIRPGRKADRQTEDSNGKLNKQQERNLTCPKF